MPVPSRVAGTFVAVAAPGVTVPDAAAAVPGDARNYTVIQVRAPWASSTYLLYASQVVAGGYPAPRATTGTGGSRGTTPTGAADAPNGQPGGLTPFNAQMEAWCSACHTRYHADPGGPIDDSGDPIFRFRHQTTGRTTCTTCSVAHRIECPNARSVHGWSAVPRRHLGHV